MIEPNRRAARTSPDTGRPVEAAPQGLTVMTIDDNEFDQLLNRRVLERAGVFGEILQFYLGTDALDYFRSPHAQDIDLILLDVNMPGMTGFEFLERAVAELGPEFAKCVVIMLTTSLDPRDLANARRFEIVRDYLGKPLTVEDALRVSRLITEPE